MLLVEPLEPVLQPPLLAKTPLSLILSADEFDCLVLPGWWQLRPSERKELQNEVQQHVDYCRYDWPHWASDCNLHHYVLCAFDMGNTECLTVWTKSAIM
jgi:hypothetical protein